MGGSSFDLNLVLHLGFQQEGFRPPESPPGEGGMDGLGARRKDSGNKPLRGTAAVQGWGVAARQGAGMGKGHGKWFTGDERLSLSLVFLAAFAKYECKN